MDHKFRELRRRQQLEVDDPHSIRKIRSALKRRQIDDVMLLVDNCIDDLRSKSDARRERARLKAGEASEIVKVELDRRMISETCQKRRRAFEASWELRLLSFPQLITVSHDESAPMRARAAQLLSRHPFWPRQVSRHQQIADSDEFTQARDRLLELLGDRKRYVREAAIESCGRMLRHNEDVRLRDALTDLLADKSSKIRECATEALLETD